MSASRFPIKKISAIAALTIGVRLSRINVKALVISTLTGPGSKSRIIAILLLLANAKVLPFAWHYRVFQAFLKHLFSTHYKFEPTAIGSKAIGPAALFEPIITSSRSPLYECDYNLHKSNSTYFSDLDITRSHIVCALFRDGIEALKINNKTHLVKAPDGSTAKGGFFIMLGGTMCSFKREIKPYESYEMWSRILCWDRKWLFIVTHFVKKGAVQPDGYTLGPPSKGMFARFYGEKKGKRSAKKAMAAVDAQPGGLENKNIYASALSKYVMKVGRLTVHPEVYLEASGLLPPKPGGWVNMSGTATPSEETEIVANGLAVNGPAAVEAVVNGSAVNGAAINGSANANLATATSAEVQWDWKRVEAENARGMKLAVHFAAMEGLHGEFTSENRPALSVETDFLW